MKDGSGGFKFKLLLNFPSGIPLQLVRSACEFHGMSMRSAPLLYGSVIREFHRFPVKLYRRARHHIGHYRHWAEKVGFEPTEDY